MQEASRKVIFKTTYPNIASCFAASKLGILQTLKTSGAMEKLCAGQRHGNVSQAGIWDWTGLQASITLRLSARRAAAPQTSVDHDFACDFVVHPPPPPYPQWAILCSSLD